MTTTITLLPETELGSTDPEASFGVLSTPAGNLPLKLMDVKARITGLLNRVELRQTYVNTLSVPVEATYVFPLPDRAAVSAFRLEVGERVVEGELQERGQARRNYDQALRQGHRAAISEEDRSGVFTMRVGNLMPGDEATVWLTLSGPLAYSEGEATFRFPLVVAPRYVPGRTLSGEQAGQGVQLDTDAVPDASRISPPVLLPGCPNPVQLSVAVEIDGAGLQLGTIRSSLHAVTTRHGGGLTVVELQPGERLDRDVILRFELGSPSQQVTCVTYPDPERADAGTFLLTLLPPVDDEHAARARDVVFVLDRSGSMEGWKMVAARRATARMVDSLTERDRFSVLAFDNEVEAPRQLPPSALHVATDRNRFRAVEFLAGVEARGGTDMGAPLSMAAHCLQAQLTADPARERIVVLVTDGQVGNEDQLLRSLGASLSGVRVFSLGIDQAVNAGFLRRLAGLGSGACELVESEDRLDEVLEQVHRQIATPILSGVRVRALAGAVLAESLVPNRLPDLFDGTPLTIQGRFEGVSPEALRLEVVGRRGSEEVLETVSASPSSDPAIEQAWARGQIRQLEDQFVVAFDGGLRATLEQRIVQTSLRHRVLCRFTAFVAVDRAQVVNEGGQQHRVVQAVESPRGWADSEVETEAASFACSSQEDLYPIEDFDQTVSYSSRVTEPFGGAPFGGAPFGGGFGDGLEDSLDASASGSYPVDPFGAPASDAFSVDSSRSHMASLDDEDDFGTGAISPDSLAGGFAGAGADPFVADGDPFRVGGSFRAPPLGAPSPNPDDFLLDEEEEPAPPPASSRPIAPRASRPPSPPASRSAPPANMIPAQGAFPSPAPGAPLPPQLGAHDLPELPVEREEQALEDKAEASRFDDKASKIQLCEIDSREAKKASAGPAGKRKRAHKQPSPPAKAKKQGFFGRLREAFRGGGSKPGEVPALEVARRRLIGVHRELQQAASGSALERLAALRNAAPELRELIRELEQTGGVPARLLEALSAALDRLAAAPGPQEDGDADRLWTEVREALRSLRKVLAPSDAGGNVNQA